MLLTILAIVAIALVIFLAVVAMRPNTFKLATSTVINAPPDKIYPYVADFHKWREWSPYEDVDPNLQRTYSGATEGKGAIYDWAGQKAGTGRMEITVANAPSKILIDLHFMKPFNAHNTVDFEFVPQGGATAVTWAMTGPLTFMAKLMHMFFSMEKMVGTQHAKGLATLKAVAEK